MSLVDRVPSWFKEDPTIKTVNSESEKVRVSQYFDRLGRAIKQPGQLWVEFDKEKVHLTKSPSMVSNVMTDFDKTYIYPSSFEYRITNSSDSASNITGIHAPITFDIDNGNSITINRDLPLNSTTIIQPGLNLSINNKDKTLMNLDFFDIIRTPTTVNYVPAINGSTTEHVFGQANNDTQEKYYEFHIDTTKTTKGINIKVGKTYGNPLDDVVVELYKSSKPGEYDEFPLERHQILNREWRKEGFIDPFDILLPIGHNLESGDYILLFTRDDLNSDFDYYTVMGSETKIFCEIKVPSIELNNEYPSLQYKDSEITISDWDVDENVEDISFEIIGEAISSGTIFLRAEAEELFPLKKIQVYQHNECCVESDELIFEENYKKVCALTYKLIDIDIDFSEGLKESQKGFEKYYAKIYYHGFDIPKVIGFPKEYTRLQNTDSENILLCESLNKTQEFFDIVTTENQMNLVYNDYKEEYSYSGFPDLIQQVNNNSFLLRLKRINPDKPFTLKNDTIRIKSEYQPNKNLDLHAKSQSMFRRIYREDIQLVDYPLTYPIGYPYIDEQDYWLEKRLLNEYPRKLVPLEKVIFKDLIGTEVLILECNDGGVHNIEIVSYLKEDITPTIEIIDTDSEDIERGEEFEYSNIYELVKKINQESKLLKATYLTYTESTLELAHKYISTQGTYPKFGLIPSEVHGYLGVIPTIKDMMDYVLVWGARNWGDFVWEGDIWSPAVFQVEIPYSKIPKNIKKLELSQIDTILQRCKKVGTDPIPIYKEYGYLDLETNIDLPTPEYVAGLNLELDINAGNYIRKLGASIAIGARTELVQKLSNSPLNVGIGLTAKACYINLLTTFNQETSTDFARGYSSQLINSSNTLTIDRNERSLEKTYPRESALSSSGSIASWSALPSGNTLLSSLQTKSDSKYVQAQITPTKLSTARIHLYGWGFNIPLLAKITGVLVTFNGMQVDTGTRYLRVKARINGSNDLTSSTFLAASYGDVTLGGSTNLWGITLTPEIINEYGFSLSFIMDATSTSVTKTGRIDNAKIRVYYKFNGGTYITERAIFPTTNADKWQSYEYGVTMPSQCGAGSLTCNVIKDNVDQEQNDEGSMFTFGNSMFAIASQTFRPTNSKLSSVRLVPKESIGSPTDDILIQIRETSGGLPVSPNFLQEYRITNAKWVEGISNGYIYAYFSLNLNINNTYAIVLKRAGSVSNTNMFNCSIGGGYSNGSLIYSVDGGSINQVTTDDLTFKTYYSSNLLTNIIISSLNYDVTNNLYIYDSKNIPAEDVRLQINFRTNDVGYTPTLDKIKIKYLDEVI